MFLLIAGPPNRLVPGISIALSVGFCILGFGTLGALVPERPGEPVYDFLNLSGPAATCGLASVAMLPALVAPAVACSPNLLCVIISLIFIIITYLFCFFLQKIKVIFSVILPPSHKKPIQTKIACSMPIILHDHMHIVFLSDSKFKFEIATIRMVVPGNTLSVINIELALAEEIGLCISIGPGPRGTHLVLDLNVVVITSVCI
jgi:hypothetical protein